MKDSLPLSILDELVYKIDNFSQNIVSELGSGDEVLVLEFLRAEIEPLFDHFVKKHPAAQPAIQAYRDAINNPYRVVYN